MRALLVVGAVVLTKCEYHNDGACFGAGWALGALKRRAFIERTPPERRRRAQVPAAAFGALTQKC